MTKRQTRATPLHSASCGLLLALTAIVAGCKPAQTPVEEVTAGPSAIDADATTYTPPAGDWPWWRGPTFDGHAPCDTAPVQFGEETNVIWRTGIPGRGNGSPTVSGDKVFLATAARAKQEQMIVALNRATGDLLWTVALNQGGFPSASQMHNKSTHANGTVAVNGEAVFAAFLHHGSVTAYAVDYEGELLWERELGPFNSKFGYAPSPVIYKSVVIFAADNRGGGYLAAVDQASGEIVWRKARPAVATYSSPVVAHVAGRDQLLISGNQEVVSYDPATGDENWSCPGTAEATCGTVVWTDDMVFASGGYPQRETVAVDAATGEQVWQNRTQCYEQSMLVVGEYLYAVNDDGIAFCWHAATGKEQWKKRLGGDVSASLVFCGGNIYAANESGTFYVFAANPEEFVMVAENNLGDSTFATPVICGGKLYQRVRYHDRGDVLVCFGEGE